MKRATAVALTKKALATITAALDPEELAAMTKTALEQIKNFGGTIKRKRKTEWKVDFPDVETAAGFHKAMFQLAREKNKGGQYVVPATQRADMKATYVWINFS